MNSLKYPCFLQDLSEIHISADDTVINTHVPKIGKAVEDHHIAVQITALLD